MTLPPTLTRRKAIRLCGAAPLAAWAATRTDSPPPLAAGTPSSPERLALIDAFRRSANGLDGRFEKRTHRGAWTMPYRLFRPATTTKVPLVLYLHGSGGLGDDNEKQLGLGNVFGTLVWALPENQRRFPCCIVAPQTDRGWARDKESPGGAARLVPRVRRRCANGARHRPADRSRAADRRSPPYVAGQSMGGAGVWNLLAHRPRVFAAAGVVCGSPTEDDITPLARLPLWNFHGSGDRTVPVDVSRSRIAALRKAGGAPLSTEYAGVDHNAWEWAFTEPALPEWLFAQRRST